MPVEQEEQQKWIMSEISTCFVQMFSQSNLPSSSILDIFIPKKIDYFFRLSKISMLKNIIHLDSINSKNFKIFNVSVTMVCPIDSLLKLKLYHSKNYQIQ